MAGWIPALIASLFGAGEEVEKILEEELLKRTYFPFKLNGVSVEAQ